MSVRSLFAALCVATSLLASVANAASLVSAPLSHPAGFQSLTCHIINGGTKDIVISSFVIDDVELSSTYANTAAGCSGFGPWTLGPGEGCSRAMVFLPACAQPDGCYCRAIVSGSTTSVRGNLIGTVNSSTTVMTSELRAK